MNLLPGKYDGVIVLKKETQNPLSEMILSFFWLGFTNVKARLCYEKSRQLD